jgi:hypothetical protein
MKTLKQSFQERKKKLLNKVAKKIKESNLNFEPLKTLSIFDFSPYVLFNIYLILLRYNILSSFAEFVNTIILVISVSFYFMYFSMRFFLIKASNELISYQNTRSLSYFISLVLSLFLSVNLFINLFFLILIWSAFRDDVNDNRPENMSQ